MRKYYSFLILLFTVFISNAQIVNIPDANFKAIITNPNPLGTLARDINGNIMVVDTNIDGEIQVSEALNVYSFNAGARNISSLMGIEYFTNLRTLIFNSNDVSSINVSPLVNLTFLNCNDNNLSVLNVSGLNNLQYLLCSGNNLSSLNANGLSNLLLFSCGNNNLNSLTVSGCSALEDLSCDQNNLTTLDLTNLSSLITLRCSYNSLSSIVLTGLVSLKDLICNNNLLSSLNLNGLNSIENLFCYYNSLTTLNAGNFPNLMNLVCSYNQMTSLNVTGSNNLLKIDCRNNSLPSINLSGLINLKNLYIAINQLTALDVDNLISLENIECNQNHISSLNVSTLLNLKTLNCDSNQITSLTLGNLTFLNNLTFASNNIASIDISGLTALIGLNCSYNSLSTLNANGLSFLQSINCRNNQLTSLYVDGLINMTSLYCQNNFITSLDVITLSALNFLDCSNNMLNSLNFNGLTNFQYLNAQTNQLTSLFIKNGINEQSLALNYNPNLSYICADESQLTVIQNALNLWGYTNCNLNSYCSFEPGGTFYTIQGNNKFDSNSNGCDANDIVFPNQKFTITNGSISGTIIADQSGTYSIPVQSGSHTITPVFENPSYFTISPASTTFSFPATASPATRNFCITANGVKNDLEVTIIPLAVARPGFDAHYRIIYKNKGNQVANGSLSFTFDDAIMDLVSATPVNDNAATNTLSWNYGNLVSLETREIDLIFNINSPMEIPAVNANDVLDYTATIVGATDETPNDNTFTLNQTVVNSYDPNDKTCLEGATITPSMVGQYVHYVIRFENTGTFAAENIVVKDMIDTTKFDVTTLIPQHSSHDFFTRINGNKVEFIFENINLPFDDANNDGYVAFKIKTKPTLVLGNTFTNSASIYFDYNFPIVTDPAVTTVALLNTNDFDFGTYFTLYPNPAKDVLNFEVKNEIGVKSISVYNTLGQIVMAITNVDNLKSIDVSSLTAGSYFVKVYTDKGSSSSKFIKQ